jgi:hypothetical protein
MIGQYDRVAMPSLPMFWPHDCADRSYNNLLSKQDSFPRTLRFTVSYKTGHYCAHTLPITFAFAYSPSVLLFPSPSHSMANTSVPHPTSPSAPSINDDDSGYNSATESTAMVTLSSPTRGVIKMDDGEILELVDFFKKTIVTEADHQAYHDLDWLSGNLLSFIPEVDVPIVEGSTVLCFEC